MKKFSKIIALLFMIVLPLPLLGGCLGVTLGGANTVKNRFILSINADDSVDVFINLGEENAAFKSELASAFTSAGWTIEQMIGIVEVSGHELYAVTQLSMLGINLNDRPGGKDDWTYGLFRYTADFTFANPIDTLFAQGGNLFGVRSCLADSSWLDWDDAFAFQYQTDSIYTKTNRTYASGYYHVFETTFSKARSGASEDIHGRLYAANMQGWYIVAILAGGIFIGSVFLAKHLKDKKRRATENCAGQDGGNIY